MIGFPSILTCADFFLASLRKLDIAVTLTPKSWPVLTQIARKAETTPHMWWSWRSTYYPDPHNWIGEMFHSEKWGSWPGSSWYKNPKVEELLDKAVRIVDKKEREKL